MTADCQGGAVVMLRQAHEVLNREWPGRDASAQAWRAHHERAAALYARVAETDADHYHEALFFAAQEREAARALSGSAESVAVRAGGGGDE